MAPLRKNALILLGVATLLPVASTLFFVFHVYTEYTSRGLAFEGKGALSGILLMLGCTALLWLSSVAVYASSLLKETAPGASSRVVDLALYLVLPLGLWFVFRIMVPT